MALLCQLPEATACLGAGTPHHAHGHFLKAVSETKVVANVVLPAFWSRPKKGEVLSVDRRDALEKAVLLHKMQCP